MEGYIKRVVMKLEKVNYNVYNAPLRVGNTSTGTIKANQSFKGTATPKEVSKELKGLMPWGVRFVCKLAEGMGEVQNICINALGTGLVAPVFIKYNPLSKADEDTRTYSAWRQPISAVLAVATQAGMVAPFNSVISNMAYTGEYPEEYNMSNLKDEKYIRKLLKKSDPSLTADQLKVRVQEELKRQHINLRDDVINKNKILLKTPKGSVPLSEKAFNGTISDTIQELIKSDTAKLKSTELKEERRLARSLFYSEQSEKIIPTLEGIGKDLEGIKTLKEAEKYFKNKIKELKHEKAPKEMIRMLNEMKGRIQIIATPPKVDGKPQLDPQEVVLQEIKDKNNKMLERVKEYTGMTDKTEIEQKVAASVADRKSALTKSLEALEELKTKISSGEKLTVSQIQKFLEEKAGGISFKDSALHCDFTEEFLTKYKNNIENNLKGHKQFTGLVISLAVLPITCCLLNWVYPRFMDAVFPNLSNKKHDNESKQLIDKAPKQVGGVA